MDNCETVSDEVERHKMVDVWSNGEEEVEEVAWDADEKKEIIKEGNRVRVDIQLDDFHIS